MPEYLAPGVYVEETSFRSKSIEGVSTTTTGFIGPTRFGPVYLTPDIVTSLGEFERMYGDRQQLAFSDVTGPMHNYMWHAARAFFEEGGQRLYVARVFRPLSGAYPPANFDGAQLNQRQLYDDGHARGTLPVGAGAGASQVWVRARFPGAAGSDLLVVFTVRLSQNILSRQSTVGSLLDRDVVWITRPSSPPSSSSPSPPGDYYVAESYFDQQHQTQTWRFHAYSTSPPMSFNVSPPAGGVLELESLDFGAGDLVRVVTLTVTVVLPDGSTLVYPGLPLDPAHKRAGFSDSVFDQFSKDAASLSQALRLPVVISKSSGVNDGLDVLEVLFSQNQSLRVSLDDPQSTDAQRSIQLQLAGGNDGQRPSEGEYEGEANDNTRIKTGLKIFEDIEDISILAAPGATYNFEDAGYQPKAEAIINLLIAHAEQLRYRIAVLDSGDGQAVADVRQMRGRMDSTYGALYYPWIRILDPVTQKEIVVPPSGAVTGIYARNDIQRAVYKAPANEVVNTAIGFELLLNKSQQDVLNPEGINCFRFFEGRGFRLWGARTISSDPEWKYVNLRRYFIYLERSIDRGTQWAVFEPNGERLWANVRRTISDFLLNEWQMGALLGDKPEKAYFVKCDRSTMTQNDLDNGRLVCLIGVAPLYPAEFVIFRIGQWTADAKI